MQQKIMISQHLSDSADIAQKTDGRAITKLMYLIWESRSDLRNTFDLDTVDGQKSFIQWFDVAIDKEYVRTPVGSEKQADPENVLALEQNTQHSRPSAIASFIQYQKILRIEAFLAKSARKLPKPFRESGRRLWKEIVQMLLKIQASRIVSSSKRPRQNEATPVKQKTEASNLKKHGYNLIGHAFAELGMGEHVRMSAAALATTDVPFGVINYEHGVLSRMDASLEHGSVTASNDYPVNLFHLNADQILNSYLYYGAEFYSGKHNIIYPFWELSKWPKEWVSVLDVMDEIWAPTKFIEEAIAPATKRPVIHMPVAVTLPDTPGRPREYFGLPSDEFLFLFTFDSFSFIERKNPYAILRAFQNAFPLGSEKVGLVIKSMNATTTDPRWRSMVDLIGDDKRIHVINRTMPRYDLIDLFKVSDCFVSLHRAEGFGRGPAEAMLLGKPTIVTNYSGNLEFCNEQNCCLVNYKLIPIESDQYVMPAGQMWADPDENHAAQYMQKLVQDPVYAKEVGDHARDYMVKNFNAEIIGNKYRKRLAELGL